MSRHDRDDELAQFLTSVGAAWYAIALDEIMGWATAIGGFRPGRVGGEGYIVRGDELGPEFADWIQHCATHPDARDTLTIVVSDIAPDVVARIQILGARATTQVPTQEGRVVIAYNEVIIETARQTPTP
ncbi:hypothetical protein [Nocardia sp. NPDC055049]